MDQKVVRGSEEKRNNFNGVHNSFKTTIKNNKERYKMQITKYFD